MYIYNYIYIILYCVCIYTRCITKDSRLLMIAVYDPLPTVKALKRKEEILNKVDSAEHFTALCFCIPFASQFSHFRRIRRPPDDRPNRSLRLKQQTAVRSGSSWVNPVMVLM